MTNEEYFPEPLDSAPDLQAIPDAELIARLTDLEALQQAILRELRKREVVKRQKRTQS